MKSATRAELEDPEKSVDFIDEIERRSASSRSPSLTNPRRLGAELEGTTLRVVRLIEHQVPWGSRRAVPAITLERWGQANP